MRITTSPSRWPPVRPSWAGQIVRALSAAVCICLMGCTRERVPGGEPGAPLPDLSPAELAEFRSGRELFTHQFTPEEGLGPAFNDEQCSACHDLPTVGGSGADQVRKATRFEGERCDLLTEAGGDLLQSNVTPAMQAHGFGAEPIPRQANATADIAAPSLFGLGAIAAIPDEAILSRADPDDKDGDGISGRAGRSFDGRLGRFGRKATFATIRAFITGALSGEMGITTRAFPKEESFGGQPLPAGVDPRPEPELDDVGVDRLTRFVELLAPPAGAAAGNAAARDSVRRGQRLFGRIGCAECHTPALPTGDHATRALNSRELTLYSDLLLHDLGPQLASVCAPFAGPSEWRTASLVGLRFKVGFLHQGQALSLEKAVRLHGGEAEAASRRFQALSPAEQAFVYRFLLSL